MPAGGWDHKLPWGQLARGCFNVAWPHYSGFPICCHVAWLSKIVLLDTFLVFNLFSERKRKTSEPHMFRGLQTTEDWTTEENLLRFMKHLAAPSEIFPVVPGVYSFSEINE